MAQDLATRLALLLRARHACLSITTEEEDVVLTTLGKVCLDLGRPLLRWSAVGGVVDGAFAQEVPTHPDTEHPAGALRWWTRSGETRALVLCDLAAHLEQPVVLRAAREAIFHARTMGSTLILVDHQPLPAALAAEAVPVEVGLPDDVELFALAKDTLRRLREVEPITVDITVAQFNTLVRHLRGLTRTRAMQVLRDAAIADGRLDAADVERVAHLKRRMLRERGLLTAVDAPVGLDEVAGLEGLKHWLAVRRPADGPEAPTDPPRGILVLGVPGTGKSLCAKAIAAAWNRPLLRLDAGVLYDRWIGSSEERLRGALAQAEAMAPAVLWIDEIEKAFASAAAHSTDGGLSQRLFGSFLVWLQEHRAPVFVVATANTIEGLPPELLRKGRFDEVFFVDLPDEAVRADLWRIHLNRRDHALPEAAILRLAAAATDRTGAEIEQVVVAASHEARFAKQALAETHLLAALEASPPLAVTMAESIDALRGWASGRCARA